MNLFMLSVLIHPSTMVSTISVADLSALSLINFLRLADILDDPKKSNLKVIEKQ